MYHKSRAPVKEGDEIELQIESTGEKGDGIAKTQGFVVIVPGSQANEKVKVKITRVLRNYAFAEIIEKL